MVMASRLADAPAPIDGATAAIEDEDQVAAAAATAAELGFRGKLSIHPAEVVPGPRGVLPGAGEIRRRAGRFGRARTGEAGSVQASKGFGSRMRSTATMHALPHRWGRSAPEAVRLSLKRSFDPSL